MTLLAMDVVRMDKISDHALKLEKIFTRCVEIIEEFHPDELAIEAPFFGKNVQSMLKLGRAQGVAIAAALSHKLTVVEYAPRKIKQSITGNGNASKEQVAAMLQQILKINQADMPKKMDATDGVAAAVCHYFQTSSRMRRCWGFPCILGISQEDFLQHGPTEAHPILGFGNIADQAPFRVMP